MNIRTSGRRKAAKPPPAEPDDPKPALIGYARVSTEDQNLDLQIDALRKAGCVNIWQEHVSGAAKVRTELDHAIADLRPGETLVVWRLDRLARSMRDLYARLDQIYAQGAGVRSLTESFDFGTVTGKFVLGILGLVAELERQLTIVRTKAGMAAAKARGKTFGRVRRMTPAAIDRAEGLLKRGWKVKAVAKAIGVKTPSIYGHFWIKGGKVRRKARL